jgi:[NiFe] hydrogenase assembly HybE family chaperone
MSPPRSACGAPPQGGDASGRAEPDPRRSLGPAITLRGAALERLFVHIAATRMRGVPIVNNALRVQAVGFELDPDAPAVAIGVLVTPWFMNLVRLPLDAQADDLASAGTTRERAVGNERFPFIGAQEPGFGRYEVCSLFSPMGEFADQDGAVATARAVLAELRRALPVAPAPSRRALLLGRAAAPGARS